MAYPLFHPDGTANLPMTMSVADFRSAFPTESELLEFKQGLPEGKVQEAVVAFSNTAGGVILLGVAPDGGPRGLAVDGEFLARVHRAVALARDPGRYEVYELLVDDRTLVVVSVARRREGFSQTGDGRILVRRGAMNSALFGSALGEFVAGRVLGRFESTATELRAADADPILLEELAAAWGWPVDADLTSRLIEQGLLDGTDGDRLTVAGALYLLPEPHLTLGKTYVEVFRYRDRGTSYDRRASVTGPLTRQVAETTSLIVDELGSDLVVLGVRRYDLPRLPEGVLREAVANAVAHRVYEDGRRPVRVEIRPDSVTITSPGPLPEPVTVANIRDQNAARNVSVIATLRRFRLAEDAGRGVDLMEDVMAANLLDPPEFVDDGTSVTVRLVLSTTVTPAERAWLQEVERRGEIRPPDRVLLVHAARGVPLTNSYAREVLDVDSVDARNSLQRLRDADLLRQTGERGGAVYYLSPDLSPPAGLRLEPAELDALIVALADEGPITNQVVRERTGLDRARALAILTTLVEEGRLVRRGERRGSWYERPSEAAAGQHDRPADRSGGQQD
jgi:ATP-dependent DNA helicase RecG